MLLKKIISFILIIILSFYLNIGNFVVFALSPNDISNKVFFLDAQDTDWDWDNSNEPANNSKIANLIDKFNSNTWSQTNTDKQALYKTNSINSYPSLYFDWTNDLLDLKDNLEISVWTWYTEKSYAMIIKTSDDINNFQTIYDEGTKERWFSIQIENWHLYAWVYNTLEWWNQNRTIDLWTISTNEIYTIIFIYSKTWDYIKAYLNWELKWTLNSIEEQITHWACTFTTSFNCSIYSTGWALAIGATKNDILKLSDSSTSLWFEKDFFKWYIWEISSYNHALTDSEVDWLNDYLFTKWWFDNISPIIDSINFSNNQILPGWTHDIILTYSDTWTWATWIDSNTANPYLEKWNSTNSTWDNITASGLNSWTITNSWATYTTQNLDFWKYRFNFNIKDNAWNISDNKEIIFYIDKPELTVSTWSVNIWKLSDSEVKLSDNITITVKTIWAPFKVKLQKNTQLTHSNNSDFIPYYNWSVWMWYDKNNDWSLSDFNDDIIMQEVKNINTDWDLNTYTYTLKIWAIIDKLQAGWDYTGKIDFWIELDY